MRRKRQNIVSLRMDYKNTCMEMRIFYVHMYVAGRYVSVLVSKWILSGCKYTKWMQVSKWILIYPNSVKSRCASVQLQI